MPEAEDLRLQWGRIGRCAGVVSGIALLAQTILFLVDALGLVEDPPDYVSTAAGDEQDLANYFTAFFQHQHTIVWDIAIRDVLGPIAYLAMGILAIALTQVLGARRPDVVLTARFLQIGAGVAALSDLTYLSTVGMWRLSGFRATPSADIVAAGRTYEQINNLCNYLQYTGFSTLVVALALLGRLCLRDATMPTRLGWLAWIEAAVLAALVTSYVLREWDIADMLALVTGALLGPAVIIWTGVAVHRRARQISLQAPISLGASYTP